MSSCMRNVHSAIVMPVLNTTITNRSGCNMLASDAVLNTRLWSESNKPEKKSKNEGKGPLQLRSPDPKKKLYEAVCELTRAV
ncbi:hypothetical protein QQF64_015773 [Cirrhinus molitorella]|uniref:Uncharacterized protein n=1 Tax=Cirrhinus molitorella TaxID=172907 RepID=A0ABR3NVX6_9TELE